MITLLSLLKLLEAAAIPSISALLRKADVSRQSWDDWMAGRTSPTVPTLTRMAEVLKCSVGVLLDAITEYRDNRKEVAASAVTPG